MKVLILLFIFISINSSASSVKDNSKENSFVDFKEIKNLIKNDGLDKIVSKKQREAKEATKRKRRAENSKYKLPTSNDFWKFISELWLVKNSQVVRWDFKKPVYGVGPYFKSFLEKMGYFEVNFKILYVDTPNITHFSLPEAEGEFIFLLSVPFIRALDLSKQEISLLLFEEFLRARSGFFKQKINKKYIGKVVDGDFLKKKKIDTVAIKKILGQYDEIVYIKGFSFQEQFHITKMIRERLKTDMKLWQVYYQMIQKIDELVKTNSFYRKYTRIYPSPELQLSWLKGKSIE